MLTFKLAFRNIVGAGLRTWLNVFVLSLSFVTIIWSQGFIQGMNKQVMDAMIVMEIGGGQFWHKSYDKYDPLTIDEAHGVPSESLNGLIKQEKAAAILIASGAIFPEGRVQSVLLKGIDPKQKIIAIPSKVLQAGESEIIPALIGGRMAAETRLSKGDYVTVRWRDVHGTFDAADVRIAEIMKTSVQSVDASQIWVPIEALRKMIQAPGEATIIVLEKKINYIPDADENWNYHDPHFLLKDIKEFIRAKSAGASIFYVLLLLMALLAIFDTQVLSVFRRRREIGTLMAMGLARSRVIGLFTVEGALHGIMAFALGALYGVPLLIFSAVKGFALPRIIDKTGFALSEKLYPSYGTGLVIGTTIIVMITVTIVSFLPTRKISDLKPTEALRGKAL